MNATKAAAQARTWWGADGRARMDPLPSSPATRAQGKADQERLDAELKACTGVMTDKERLRQLRRDRDRARGLSCYHQCSVGEVQSFGGFGMFLIHGQGDTLEEAFEAAEKAGYGKGWKEKARAKLKKKVA